MGLRMLVIVVDRRLDARDTKGIDQCVLTGCGNGQTMPLTRSTIDQLTSDIQPYPLSIAAHPKITNGQRKAPGYTMADRSVQL